MPRNVEELNVKGPADEWDEKNGENDELRLPAHVSSCRGPRLPAVNMHLAKEKLRRRAGKQFESTLEEGGENNIEAEETRDALRLHTKRRGPCIGNRARSEEANEPVCREYRVRKARPQQSESHT
jgi:hypothetical protein